MQRLLLFILIFPSFRTAAQEEYYGPYAFKIGSEQYVWADSANIRETSSMQSPVLATVPAGSTLKILGIGATLAAGKKAAPWYAVSATIAGTTITGHIWGGLLSLDALQAGDIRFVFGYESTTRLTECIYDSTGADTTARLTVCVKAVKDSKVLDRRSYNIYEDAVNGIAGTLGSNRNLPAFSRIVQLVFSGEACAIPTYTHAFGWTGTKLVPLPPLQSVSDAGSFYHSEEAMYPADKGGKAAMIIHRIREGSYDEMKDDYVDEKPVFRRYSWDAGAGMFKLASKQVTR